MDKEPYTIRLSVKGMLDLMKGKPIKYQGKELIVRSYFKEGDTYKIVCDEWTMKLKEYEAPVVLEAIRGTLVKEHVRIQFTDEESISESIKRLRD